MAEPKFLHFLETDTELLCLEDELKSLREEVRDAIINTISQLQERLLHYEPRDPDAGCPGCGRKDC